MNIAEILRKLADVVDGHSEQDSAPENSMPHAELAPVDMDHEDHTETTVVITPLQAKLELMKKSMGMDNAYDQESDSGCGCEASDEDDAELALMKQRAGVPMIAVAELADDEPFEG